MIAKGPAMIGLCGALRDAGVPAVGAASYASKDSLRGIFEVAQEFEIPVFSVIRIAGTEETGEVNDNGDPIHGVVLLNAAKAKRAVQVPPGMKRNRFTQSAQV